MNTAVVIPARLDSQRLPGKMLLKETGKELIRHTYDNIRKCWSGMTLVATPDDEIIDCCSHHGIPVLRITSGDCGTHRCLMAAKLLGEECHIINVQGDYPTFDASHLKTLARHMDVHGELCSLYYTTTDKEYANSTSHVNVVFDRYQYANYFTRGIVPHNSKYWKIHIGVYGIPFKDQEYIRNYYEIPHSFKHDYYEGEKLEQLLWMGNGHKIKMFPCLGQCVGIDTGEDYEQFRQNHTDW